MLAALAPRDHETFYNAVSKGDFSGARDFMQRRYIAPFRYGNPLRMIPIFQDISSGQWQAIQTAGLKGRTSVGRSAPPSPPPEIAPGALERPNVLYGEPAPSSRYADDAADDDAAHIFRTLINYRTDETGKVVGDAEITCWRVGGNARPAAASRPASWSDHGSVDLPACVPGSRARPGAPSWEAGRVKHDDLTDESGLRQITKDGIDGMGEFILIP